MLINTHLPSECLISTRMSKHIKNCGDNCRTHFRKETLYLNACIYGCAGKRSYDLGNTSQLLLGGGNRGLLKGIEQIWGQNIWSSGLHGGTNYWEQLHCMNWMHCSYRLGFNTVPHEMINNCDVQVKLQQFLNMAVMIKEMALSTGILLFSWNHIWYCLVTFFWPLSLLLSLLPLSCSPFSWEWYGGGKHRLSSIFAKFQRATLMPKKETASSHTRQGCYFSAIFYQDCCLGF